MLTIKQFLRFAYDIEYEIAYDLTQQRTFSSPKIYTANGNLKKRWYVYFSYRDPETDKLKRVTPFYGNANSYKTKELPMEILTVYRKVILKLLKQGYNPFADNAALYQQLNQKEKAVEQIISKEEKTIIPTKKEETPSMCIREAFEFGLK